MNFWDSSALIPLFVKQKATKTLIGFQAADPAIVAWILSDVEFHSAIRRLEREGHLSPVDAAAVAARFDAFWIGLSVVSAVDAVKARAKRLLRLHALRSADALQLGAALAAATDDPTGWSFVSQDDRLRDAALREGFRVIP